MISLWGGPTCWLHVKHVRQMWFGWEDAALSGAFGVGVPGDWIMTFHVLGIYFKPNWRTHIFQRGWYTTNQMMINQVCGYLGQPELFPALSGDIFGTLRQLKITYLYMFFHVFFPLKRSSYRRIIYPWNLPISWHIAMEISAHRQGTNIVAHFRMSWSVRCRTFSFFGVKIGVGARSQLAYFIKVCNGSHGPFIDDLCCFLMFFRWCTSFNRWIMFNIEHGPWLP